MSYNYISCNNLEDLKKYQRSFIKNELPKELSLLEWFHLQNPVKEMYIDFAIPETDSSDVAAIYAVFPVYFTVFDKTVKATQSIDTLTDINHRGKGLFNTLAKSVYQKSADNNCSLVYGFPNDQSAHGFFNKLGWKNLGEVPFIFKPLRTKYFLKSKIKNKILQKFLPNISLSFTKEPQLPKNYSLVDITKFDEPFTELWQKFTKNKAIGIKRDAAYLNWRFIDKPFETYICKGLYIAQKLEGYIIYTLKEKHNGNIGYVMELVYNPAIKDAASLLLKHTICYFNKNKADVILAWNLPNSINNNEFKKQKFWILPSKLRPIKLFFGAKSYDASLDTSLFNESNWYLSYADSDTV